MNIKDVLGRIELYTNCDELTLKRIEYLLKEFKPEKEVEIQIIERHIIERKQPKSKGGTTKYIPTKPIYQFAAEYSELNNVDLSTFKVRNRSRAVIEKKRDFCTAAYKAGYLYASIGTFLKMHHSSIINLIKDADLELNSK